MILSFARTRVWVSRKRFGMNFDLVNFVFGKCEMIVQERDTYFSKETSETLLRKCEETLYAGPTPSIKTAVNQQGGGRSAPFEPNVYQNLRKSEKSQAM